MFDTKILILVVVGMALQAFFIFILARARTGKNENPAGTSFEIFWPPRYFTEFFTFLVSVLALAFAVLLGHALWSWKTEQGALVMLVVGVVGAGLFGYATYELFRWIGYRIVTTPEGIQDVRRRASVFIAWRDIEKIESRRIMQTLRIFGRDGRRVEVAFSLKEFGRLQKMILAQLPRISEEGVLPRSFGHRINRNWFWKLLGPLLLTLAVGTLLYCLPLALTPKIFLVAFILAAFQIDRSIRKDSVRFIEIGAKEIEIQTSRQSLKFSPAAIAAVDVEDYPDAKGNILLATGIRLEDGTVFQIDSKLADPVKLAAILKSVMPLRDSTREKIAETFASASEKPRRGKPKFVMRREMLPLIGFCLMVLLFDSMISSFVRNMMATKVFGKAATATIEEVHCDPVPRQSWVLVSYLDSSGVSTCGWTEGPKDGCGEALIGKTLAIHWRSGHSLVSRDDDVGIWAWIAFFILWNLVPWALGIYGIRRRLRFLIYGRLLEATLVGVSIKNELDLEFEWRGKIRQGRAAFAGKHPPQGSRLWILVEDVQEPRILEVVNKDFVWNWP